MMEQVIIYVDVTRNQEFYQKKNKIKNQDFM